MLKQRSSTVSAPVANVGAVDDNPLSRVGTPLYGFIDCMDL